MIPNLVGVIISSIPNELRASGNSITNFFTNLIGYLPAPYFYSLIFDSTKDFNSKFAYGLIVNFSLLAFIFIIIAMNFKIKIYNEKIKKAEKEGEYEIKVGIMLNPEDSFKNLSNQM